jgi:alpha-ketoglutarate-dependent 2,4-dichlorophenoxyacetate dioxygenase
MTESTYRWIEVERFAQPFAARIGGVDITAMLDDAVFDEIRLALDEFGVLVFSNQRFNDDSQVAFSQRFGALERTISANPAGGSAFARQSNVDINSGELIGTGDGRMRYQAANMSWHADSTFKAHRSLCSVLSARVVPPQGGATQFATTRTAYEALDATRRCELESLEVVHDIVAGRRRLGYEFTQAQVNEMPAVTHRLVQLNPTTGQKSLLIGAHAAAIVGWSASAGRKLLDELLELAVHESATFHHEWCADDVIVWDNRSILHRATPYDASAHRRLMQRTTVSDGAVE